jgi:Uma2 family endonuclease
MTTTQFDFPAIQHAIRQLSRTERELLAEWILNSGDFGDRVAEAAPVWGDEAQRRLLTVEEYLDMDDDGVRYEYVAGQIFAMSNPRIRHEVIVSNLTGHLFSQLRGGSCRVFSSHAKVRLRVAESDIFYIPDAVVACGSLTEQTLELQYLTDPSVVVEVLSPSTEAIDRREKALNYRHVASLQEYLLIAQRSMSVTVYRRADDWRPMPLTQPDEVVELRAVEANMTLAEIYEGAR